MIYVQYAGPKKYINISELTTGNKYKDIITDPKNLERFQEQLVDPVSFKAYLLDIVPTNKERYKIESFLRTLKRLNIHINIKE